MATSPIYTNLGINKTVTISTANTNRDGTGTITDVIIGDSTQKLIESIQIKAQGTTTSGMIRLFRKESGSYTLIKEFNESLREAGRAIYGHKVQ